MTINELIGKNLGLNEMAQQHFDNDIVNLIKKNEFEKAAEKYIDNHGTVKLAQKATATTGKLARGDFAKTLKADPDKVKEITKAEWEKFNQAYSDLMGTSEQKKRSYKKTKGTVDSATGKIKTSAQSGATRSVSINKLEAKIQKVAAEYQAQLEKADTKEEKDDIKSHLEGLQILGQALQNTKKGEGSLPPETEAQMKKLENKYAKIEAAMGKKMDRPAAKYASDDKTETEADKDMQYAQKKLKQRMQPGLRTIDDIEDEIDDFKRRLKVKKEMEAAQLPSKIKEGMRIREQILAEGLNYHGVYFLENYVATNLLRGFNEDVKFMGAEEAREIYVFAFGEETAPIFDYMIENENLLNEVANIKGNFLFETDGLQAINNYLYEARFNYAPVGKLGDIKNVGGAAKKALTGGAVGKTISGATNKKGLVGFLGGLWDKIKSWGAPIVRKLGAAITAGAKWAKEIAQKGLSWLHANPIARVAVPAVAIAGTVAGGIALINKLRKKAGKDKLSKSEEEKLRRKAESSENELKKYGVKMAI